MLKHQAHQWQQFGAVFAQPASGALHVGAQLIDRLGEPLQIAGVGEPGFEGGGDDTFVGRGLGHLFVELSGNGGGDGVVEARQNSLQRGEFGMDVDAIGRRQRDLLPSTSRIGRTIRQATSPQRKSR